MQVQGQISLLCGGVLSFGLAHYGTSVFELLAEELLMSDSTIKVSLFIVLHFSEILIQHHVCLRYVCARYDYFCGATICLILGLPGHSSYSIFYFGSHVNHLFVTLCGMYQVYGALRMTVKMFLMWNSELHIDGGGGDTTVSTSILEASNLFVLRVLTNSYHCFPPSNNL